MDVPDFMGYDRAIVTFSPDGRLFQVEYAREAVKRGLTSVGVVFANGVVLVASKPVSSLSTPTVGSDKVHQVDDHLGVALTGIMADARVLIDIARIKAQVYKLTYDTPLHVSGAVKEISDKMQLYTQYGGVRPFGVALLVAGIDESGPQLFEIDPSAAYYGWKAQAIGKGSANATKLLLKFWKEKMTEENAVKLALDALRAGEPEAKPTDVEVGIINSQGFKKHYSLEGQKFIKKFW